MYAIADHYFIPQLKRLAHQRLTTAIKDSALAPQHTDDEWAVLITAFDNLHDGEIEPTHATDIRQTFMQYCGGNFSTLPAMPRFTELVAHTIMFTLGITQQLAANASA